MRSGILRGHSVSSIEYIYFFEIWIIPMHKNIYITFYQGLQNGRLSQGSQVSSGVGQ
jgi:hypothetical protein